MLALLLLLLRRALLLRLVLLAVVVLRRVHLEHWSASSNADAVAGLVAGCTAGVRALQTGTEKKLKESAFFLFAPGHAPAGTFAGYITASSGDGMGIQQQTDRPTVLGDKRWDGEGWLGKQSGHV